MIKKIISGGQTGADRGGLNAAICLNIPIGGWAPKGMKAEDGRVPQFYNLKEHPGDYRARTEQNVLESDATAIFYFKELSKGSALTKTFCLENNKPYILIDCLEDQLTNLNKILIWLKLNKPKVLNIAGSRSSVGEKWGKSIGKETQDLIVKSIKLYSKF